MLQPDCLLFPRASSAVTSSAALIHDGCSGAPRRQPQPELSLSFSLAGGFVSSEASPTAPPEAERPPVALAGGAVPEPPEAERPPVALVAPPLGGKLGVPPLGLPPLGGKLGVPPLGLPPSPGSTADPP
jgi:hypothetical protein